MRSRKILAKAALLLVGPIIFFVAFETVLALTGLFTPPRLLKKVVHEGRNYWTTNPAYGGFIFDRRTAPAPQPIWLAEEKPAGTKRVIVLGESAAIGFPRQEFDLARIAGALWEARHPEQPVEFATLGMVGVNSHLLRLFAREAMKLQPDAIVLYAGHNEVIGPYGPASVFGSFLPSPSLVQASLWVRSTHTGRAVERLIGAASSRARAGRNKDWEGMDEFSDDRFSFDDPRLARMLEQTKANFGAVIAEAAKHHCQVLVCVPAVNLTNWPPMASEPESERSALVAYLRAEELAAQGQTEEAWKFYRQACDLDRSRFRADRNIRDLQRQLVLATDNENVRLVDADTQMHELNSGPLTDADFFLEHVHLTFTGRVAVAAMIVDGLEELWHLRKPSEVSAADWWAQLAAQVKEAKQRLLFTEYEETVMWMSAAKLFEMDVFAAMPGRDRLRAQIAERIRTAKDASTARWRPDKLRDAIRQAQQLRPHDAMIDQTAGNLWEALRDKDASLAAHRAALAKNPFLWESRVPLAADALDRKDWPAARVHLAQLDKQLGRHASLSEFHARLHAGQDDYASALPHLLQISQDRPSDVFAQSNLAMAQEKTGDEKGAIESYRRIIALAPNDDYALANLARLLTSFAGSNPERQREAVQFARRAAELEPTNERYREILANAQKSQKSDEPATSAGR
jgi:tetratricopeptide (TPR) repeat protein